MFIVYQENRFGIFEDVSFKATPYPTPTAEKYGSDPKPEGISTTKRRGGRHRQGLTVFCKQDAHRAELTALQPVLVLKSDFA